MENLYKMYPVLLHSNAWDFPANVGRKQEIILSDLSKEIQIEEVGEKRN